MREAYVELLLFSLRFRSIIIFFVYHYLHMSERCITQFASYRGFSLLKSNIRLFLIYSYLSFQESCLVYFRKLSLCLIVFICRRVRPWQDLWTNLHFITTICLFFDYSLAILARLKRVLTITVTNNSWNSLVHVMRLSLIKRQLAIEVILYR